MKDLSNEQILHHLQKDTISRNHQLSVLVKLLNSAKENMVLAIDGSWGSGKTVFIKQLCMLADKNIEDYGKQSLDSTAIEKLRNKQKVFYFNAWENDYIDDALGAIVFKLIAEDNEALNVAAFKRAINMIQPAAAIKKISHDAIDLTAKTKKDELVSKIKDVVDRHDAVNEFLDKLRGDKERIVFVIDELDRCKPSFAVDLLEVMKHYFVRDDVTFVLAINTKELTHTVRKYYGNNFDGGTYLNKFFDFSLGLQPIDPEDYTNSVLGWADDLIDSVAHDAIEYFDFSMREINSYSSALRLVNNFIRRDTAWRKDQQYTQFILVPLAIALRIKNDSRFIDFANGKGYELLEDFANASKNTSSYAEGLVTDRVNLNQEQIKREGIAILVKGYIDLFNNKQRRRRNEGLQDFNSAVSLMGNYTTITDVEAKK